MGVTSNVLRLAPSRMHRAATRTPVSVWLVASAFASSAAPAALILLPMRLSCAEPGRADTAWAMGIASNTTACFAWPCQSCTVPCHADQNQRVVDRQRLRKIRSAGIADLVGAEIELSRAEPSGEGMSVRTSSCPLIRAVWRHAMQT